MADRVELLSPKEAMAAIERRDNVAFEYDYLLRYAARDGWYARLLRAEAGYDDEFPFLYRAFGHTQDEAIQRLELATRGLEDAWRDA